MVYVINKYKYLIGRRYLFNSCCCFLDELKEQKRKQKQKKQQHELNK
jgi:hypothetical protein